MSPLEQIQLDQAIGQELREVLHERGTHPPVMDPKQDPRTTSPLPPRAATRQ